MQYVLQQVIFHYFFWQSALNLAPNAAHTTTGYIPLLFPTVSLKFCPKWNTYYNIGKNLYRNVKFSSIYAGSKTSTTLICWPHGGPHSVFTKEFNNDIIFWLNMGYAVIRPNYRGSLGKTRVIRGKSLLESWGTTFLHDWQPPLIFVWFPLKSHEHKPYY